MIDTRPAETVPVPLTADLWSSAIFKRKVTPRELVPAILADRSAALVCLGLTALDDRTLGYLADHPSLLERIYERSATAFGAFSGSLQIEGNRVVPPGSVQARVSATTWSRCGKAWSPKRSRARNVS